MSWQATTWALRQRVGSAAVKFTLVALSNYADEHALAWPGQRRLAADTEQSIDTIQRHLRRLEVGGFVQIWERRRRGGHWPGRTYRLNMPRSATEPQNAARSLRASDDHAAICGMAEPHSFAVRPSRKAVRYEQSSDYHSTNHAMPATHAAAAAPRAGGRTRRTTQELQIRIVAKLGGGDHQAGWLAFGAMSASLRRQCEDMEAEGTLDQLAIQHLLAGDRSSGGEE